MPTLDVQTWSGFALDHGPDFDQVVHISGLVEDAGGIMNLIKDSLSNATNPDVQGEAGLPRIRVFGPTSLDYRASEGVTHTQYDGSDLVTWIQKAAGGRKDVCAAFNAVETWSASARSILYRDIIAPMVAVSGVPSRGLDFYSFIAASGFTPFGVHSDPEPSFIFHLGPETKTVWVWEPHMLSRLPQGRDITLDIEEHIDSASHKVILAPGDFLCIPGDYFHVFRNDGPAVFLGMSYYRPDPQDEILQAVAGLMQRSTATDLVSALERATSDGDLALAVKERGDLRARRGFAGAHRILPMSALPAVAQAECTHVPIHVVDGAIEALGRRVSLPQGVDEVAVRSLLAPGAIVSSDSIGKAANSERDGVRLFLALLRIGVLLVPMEAGR